MRKAIKLIFFCFLLLSVDPAISQPIDRSNAPDCSASDIAHVAETVTRYQGVRGTNPDAPSTYGLIGDHKFSGTIFGAANPFLGENWYPVRTEKQTLTGTFHRFGVSNYGDESDWNIHILPDAFFDDFIADAIPYRHDDFLTGGDWATTPDGRFLIEAEITPDERRYGNEWFDNREKSSPLLNRRLTVYGPFVREESHANHPEIHPAEQIWWKEGSDATVILLVVDDSNRFNDRSDYATRRVTTPDFVPWTQEKGQRAELSIAFELDPARGGMYLSVQRLDDFQFSSPASFPDAASGNPIAVSYRGNVVLSVDQASEIDSFVGITFRSICFNRGKGTLQGYVVLNTAIGNGDGKEGFVALHVQKRETGFDVVPALLTGDLFNQWKILASYDNSISPASIVSSDTDGIGVVDRLIDFNGNGKTDLFAKVGNSWMVLFDGRGTWQQINTSSIDAKELRFGDINGDRKTDILRVGPNKKVQVSFGGTGPWTVRTDAGEQNSQIQVGDFNGDGRTDIVYVKTVSPFPPITIADMFVKFSAQGSWKKLNDDYHLRNADEYQKMFRFGDFNGDGITDIFRLVNGVFGVYWSGTGDFKELHRPSFPIDIDDLMFVPDLIVSRSTDIVHFNRTSRKWSVFPAGKAGTLPLEIRYGDPAVVRFGDLDPDLAVEPFAIDFVPQRKSPLDIAMTRVPKATIDPVVFTKYVRGSLRRVREGERSFLTVSLNLQRSPGTAPRNRKGEDLRSISKVNAGHRTLTFKRFAALDTPPGEIETLGTIEDVPLVAAEETRLQIAFAPGSSPSLFDVPEHGMTGVVDAIAEQPGAAGHWPAWRPLLSSTAAPAKTGLLASPPAPPSRVRKVSFELAPLYAAREEGKVRLAEIDDIARELNDIAYGDNRDRATEIFGDRKPFTITWQFELKNMTAGAVLPIANPASLASNGKWPGSKVSFVFPSTRDLLRFKAIASISNDLGHRSAEPIEVVFWNQRISLAESDAALIEWLKPLQEVSGVDVRRLLVKARYLAEDGWLNPAELASILRPDASVPR